MKGERNGKKGRKMRERRCERKMGEGRDKSLRKESYNKERKKIRRIKGERDDGDEE